MTAPSPELARAILLSRLPGVTLAHAAATTGIPARTIARARKGSSLRPDRDDLLLAALTRNGERRDGALGDLALIASWLDYVNKDGSTAASVERDLARLVAEGRLAIEAGRFRLIADWP